jgi:SAM-dependent methyltransferase
MIHRILGEEAEMTPATRQKGSAERWGPLWGARPDDWAMSEEQQLPTYEAAIRRLSVEPGQKVLDVGCGIGVFLRLAADRGADVFGLDASHALLELARTRVPEADLRIGDMQQLPYGDDSFDVVTGFNSFFFAADIVASLREAARVAMPDAPVVIQVWGRPEHCDLQAMKVAVAPFLPAPDPDAPPPPQLWEPGVLEGIATEAGLRSETAFDTSWAFRFPNDDAMACGLMSAGPIAAAVGSVGEEPVRSALIEGLAPYRTESGGYRLENEWHYLVARA